MFFYFVINYFILRYVTLLTMLSGVHCHDGMTRPRVADRGDGLQIWRVAANIFISRRGRPTVDGPPAWGLGGGLTILPRKTQYLLRIITHSLGTGRITWHNLSTGKWT
jgi:hypothetical protein